MIRTKIGRSWIPLLGLVAACSAPPRTMTRTDMEQPKEQEHRKPSATRIAIPPDECRILGKVLAVDSLFRSERQEDPCSKAPCTALVRIDSVLGVGSGFARPVSAGEVLHVRFAFTLAPTKEMFPAMAESYPGLGAGDSFVASVRSAAESGSLTVFGYTKK